MSNSPTIDVERFARMFAALSNPHRLQIFLRLIEGCCAEDEDEAPAVDGDESSGPCVGELGRDLDIVPSTVSHHLKELREAGLIQMERRGRRVHCWVEHHTRAQLSGFFERRDL